MKKQAKIHILQEGVKESSIHEKIWKRSYDKFEIDQYCNCKKIYYYTYKYRSATN